MFKCKRLRNIVLLFSGLIACISLSFRLLRNPFQKYFMTAGMLAITFQSHYYFYKRPSKTWIRIDQSHPNNVYRILLYSFAFCEALV
jgi:hypothetical protein